MEELYWSGYTLAFILEVISITIAFTRLFSIKAKNFSKIGLYYSIAQGSFIEGTNPGFFSDFFGILIRLIINPFLSWFMVFLRIYGLISYINQKISIPEKVKEIQYKLGATVLNELEVRKLEKELEDFFGKESIYSYESDDDDQNTLVLDSGKDGSGYDEISLDTKNQKIIFYSTSPDNQREYRKVYEYKMVGTKLLQRLLEDKNTELKTNDYFDVKDGVVLENEIIERGQRGSFDSTDYKRIQRLKNEVHWNENNNQKIKSFILSKHPEIISKEE